MRRRRAGQTLQSTLRVVSAGSVIALALAASIALPHGADAQQGQTPRVWAPFANRNATIFGGTTPQPTPTPPIPNAPGQWRRVTPPTNTDYWAATTNGADNWVVGSNGVVLRGNLDGVFQPVNVGTGVNLYGVAFRGQNGYVAGDGGVIRRTADGGATWQASPSGVTASLGGMFFVEPCTGWVGGADGVVLKTTDCGGSWQRQNANFSSDFTAFWFADAATGWAVGNNGNIRFTSNGGATWSTQLSTGVSGDSFATIWCLTAQRCWAGGDGSLVNGQNRSNFWTTANGQTWTSIPVPMTAGTFAGPSLDAIRFVDPTRGWMATEEGFILRTVNGGSQWSVEFSEPSRPWLHGLGMRFDGSGVAAGERNTILVRSAGQ